MKVSSGIRVSRGVARKAALLFSLLAGLGALAPASASPAEGAKAALLEDVLLQSRSLANAVLQIERANAAGYAPLKEAYASLNADMKVLLQGGSRGSCQLAAPDKAGLAALEPMQEAMGMLEKAVAMIAANKETQPTLRAAVARVSSTSEALGTQLQALIDKQSAPAQMSTLKTLAHLNMLRVRINLSAERLLQSESLTPENAFTMAKDANVFGETLDGLNSGSAAQKGAVLPAETKAKVAEMAKTFATLKESSNTILQTLQRVITAKEVVGIALTNAGLIAQTSQTLAKPVPAGNGCSVN